MTVADFDKNRSAESQESHETSELLARLERGDPEALDRLLALHRPYLLRLISLQIGNEMQSRVDPSDVIQETHLAVTQRIDDFLHRRPCSYRVWLRSKALECLIEQRRRHVGSQKRSVFREACDSWHSSCLMARHMIAESPSCVVQRRELVEAVGRVIEGLHEFDREILRLRHVEGLTNHEASELLQLDPAAARKRYGRALRRLDQALVEAGIDLTAK